MGLEEPAPLVADRVGVRHELRVDLLDVAGVDAEQLLEIDGGSAALGLHWRRFLEEGSEREGPGTHPGFRQETVEG
jgi:hypothetical protein